MSNIMIISQSLTGGGAEKLAANLSIALSKTDNVILVTYTKTKIEYDYHGTRVNICSMGLNSGLLMRIFNSFKRIYLVSKIKKKYNIKTSISFLPHTDYVNVFSKNRGEKVIIDVVSNMSFVYPKGLKKAFRRYVLKKADFIVTVSEGVRQDLIDNFGVNPDKSKTIYNSCDISSIENDCEKGVEYNLLKSILTDKYICSMGSFRLAKGHWHLIKAFATIADKIPEYKLVILGEGDYIDKYIYLVKKFKIEDRVVFPGFVNYPFSIISRSRLFVFSSVFEGFGNSVIEAMVCGVPILSTDFDYGAREILAPNTDIRYKATEIEEAKYGYLLPPFDKSDIDCSSTIIKEEELMGKAILKILNNDNKDLILRARDYVNMFDNIKYGKYWKDVISSVSKSI